MVSDAACHLLFGGNGLDLSAFQDRKLGWRPKIQTNRADSETGFSMFFWGILPRSEDSVWDSQEQSDTFPVQWNGSGRALDVAKAPGRIGRQLHMNPKASLVHFQDDGSTGSWTGSWPGPGFYSLAAFLKVPR